MSPLKWPRRGPPRPPQGFNYASLVLSRGGKAGGSIPRPRRVDVVALGRRQLISVALLWTHHGRSLGRRQPPMMLPRPTLGSLPGWVKSDTGELSASRSQHIDSPWPEDALAGFPPSRWHQGSIIDDLWRSWDPPRCHLKGGHRFVRYMVDLYTLKKTFLYER